MYCHLPETRSQCLQKPWEQDCYFLRRLEAKVVHISNIILSAAL